MIALRDWWAAGSFVEVDGHRIFTTSQGRGPSLVFLHGFPTSSHDWAEVIADLARDYRCVTFDYLGFGASDKPQDANYSSVVQTERVLTILKRLGVTRASVVGHNLGGIILQQLLHRAQTGTATLEIERAIFSNSSVYAELYRPTPTQLALVDPVKGKLIAQQISKTSLEASMATLFPSHPLSADRVSELWEAISTKDGQLLWPQQLVYMKERAELGDAWVAAMHATSTPLGFIYGLADQISGEQILTHAKADLPAAQCIGLPGLGHYPQIESAPDFITALRSVLQPSASAE